MRLLNRLGLLRVLVPGGSMLLLAGCGLSDAQLTSLVQSALSTGLNAVLTNAISSLFATTTG